jgi:hypothetical protein
MSYQDRLFAHLGSYKRTALGIQEPGVYRYRGEDVLRDHILAVQHADLNLLPLARPMERMLGPGVKRHRFFHHLNSSQAFAFNLFLPYFNGGDVAASALLRALGQRAGLKSWELEAVPVEREGTNIDALWVTDDGATTFCEVKLSEAEFGTAEDDERHREKLATIYRPMLQGHVAAGALEEAEFFAAYQVLRNVWHLVRVDRSSLLFLLPRANAGLWSTLPAVLALLTSDVRARVSIVAIEDVLARLVVDEECPTILRAYAGELAAKYVPQ